MNQVTVPPFLTFLEAGVTKGGFETDDILAALLPLMKQVLAAHQSGLVAPLNGLHDLLTEQGHLTFTPAKAAAREKNIAKVEALQAAAITKPVFLPNYQSWEHAVGHHDELTDIFSLGLLLASLACGLDFTDPGELEVFTVNRTNLFGLAPRLNP